MTLQSKIKKLSFRDIVLPCVYLKHAFCNPIFFPLRTIKVMTTLLILCDLAPATCLTFFFPGCASATLACLQRVPVHSYLKAFELALLPGKLFPKHSFNVCSHLSHDAIPASLSKTAPLSFQLSIPSPAHFLYSTNRYLKLHDYLSILLFPH